jgi:hypothetical protein
MIRDGLYSAATCFILSILPSATGAPQHRLSADSGTTYYPLAVGNWWRYAMKESGRIRAIKWAVTQQENGQSGPIYHLWQTPAEGDEPLRLMELENGIAEAGSDRFLLKRPLQVGQRWASRSLGPKNAGRLQSFYVTGVGLPCSIGGHSFRECASVKESDEANNISSITTYARGVGPVKYVYFASLHSRKVKAILTISSWSVHQNQKTWGQVPSRYRWK